jgi:predicted nucleic acid-binding Zn ribbon protein
MSDAPLTDCPACGAAAFTKQLTAAGFQLKGSGWYVTDFKGGAPAAGAPSTGGDEAKSGSETAANTDSKSETKPDSKAPVKPAEAAVPANKKESAPPPSGKAAPATGTAK